jgi:hypothetical protein
MKAFFLKAVALPIILIAYTLFGFESFRALSFTIEDQIDQLTA